MPSRKQNSGRLKAARTTIARTRTPVAKIITPLIRRQAKRFTGDQRLIFDEWRKSRRIGRLSNGIPFKVSDHPYIQIRGGMVIAHVNKPIIVVSSNLSRAERRDVAEHEYFEWSRTPASQSEKTPEHRVAAKRQNRRLRQSGLEKIRKRFIPIIKTKRRQYTVTLRKYVAELEEIANTAHAKGQLSTEFTFGKHTFTMGGISGEKGRLRYSVFAEFPGNLTQEINSLFKSTAGDLGRNIVSPNLLVIKEKNGQPVFYDLDFELRSK